MANQGKGGGHQRPVKGFRPGKEPPQIRKQQAKRQFGEVSAGQERLIEMLAERSPEEARRLLRRWRVGLLAAAIILALLGAFLFSWSMAAGLVVEILALITLVVWWRIRGQRDAFEAMVDAVSRPGTRRSRKKKPRRS
jgi:hypothetical protein